MDKSNTLAMENGGKLELGNGSNCVSVNFYFLFWVYRVWLSNEEPMSCSAVHLTELSRYGTLMKWLMWRHCKLQMYVYYDEATLQRKNYYMYMCVYIHVYGTLAYCTCTMCYKKQWSSSVSQPIHSAKLILP